MTRRAGSSTAWPSPAPFGRAMRQYPTGHHDAGRRPDYALDEAGRLLAARHRVQRLTEPGLSPAYDGTRPSRGPRWPRAPAAMGVRRGRPPTAASWWAVSTWARRAPRCADAQPLGAGGRPRGARPRDGPRHLYGLAAGRWARGGDEPLRHRAGHRPGPRWKHGCRVGFGQQHVHAIREVPDAGMTATARATGSPCGRPSAATSGRWAASTSRCRSTRCARRLLDADAADGRGVHRSRTSRRGLRSPAPSRRSSSSATVPVAGFAAGCGARRCRARAPRHRAPPDRAGFLGFAAVLHQEARGLGAGRVLGEAVLAWSRDAGLSDGSSPTGARRTRSRAEPGRWARLPPNIFRAPVPGWSTRLAGGLAGAAARPRAATAHLDGNRRGVGSCCSAPPPYRQAVRSVQGSPARWSSRVMHLTCAGGRPVRAGRGRPASIGDQGPPEGRLARRSPGPDRSLRIRGRARPGRPRDQALDQPLGGRPSRSPSWTGSDRPCRSAGGGPPAGGPRPGRRHVRPGQRGLGHVQRVADGRRRRGPRRPARGRRSVSTSSRMTIMPSWLMSSSRPTNGEDAGPGLRRDRSPGFAVKIGRASWLLDAFLGEAVDLLRGRSRSSRP